MLLKELEDYLNNLLRVDDFKDYCPNGLQIEGAKEIKKIITGVTASQALIDLAIREQADAILVHHGYFWKGESAVLIGSKKKRIQSLIERNISLLAYHLPLDAHPSLGNNIQLANLLGLDVRGGLEKHGGHDLGLVCQLPQPTLLQDFEMLIEEKLDRSPLVLGPQDCDRMISKIALCTGGAQSMFEKAIEKHQVDAYITGEVSENNFHTAHEYQCNFFAAGHHATERYGAKALGEHLAGNFDIDVQFVDINNPV